MPVNITLAEFHRAKNRVASSAPDERSAPPAGSFVPYRAFWSGLPRLLESPYLGVYRRMLSHARLAALRVQTALAHSFLRQPPSRQQRRHQKFREEESLEKEKPPFPGLQC